MIPTIARRLGLGAEESDTVQFLVAQHLLLLDNAAMRDLADEEMLTQCALSVGNLERLELLLLLELCHHARHRSQSRRQNGMKPRSSSSMKRFVCCSKKVNPTLKP